LTTMAFVRWRTMSPVLTLMSMLCAPNQAILT
jgi:hypothetical protein